MRRPLAVVVLAAALVAAGAATAGAAPPVRADAHAAISPSDWLGEVNLYRAAAGLNPVTDEPSWDLGLQHHFTYLEKTDPSLMTGQYASAHTENPKSPYYKADGAQEGGASDLIEGYQGQTPVQYIDGWFRSPFHAIGMLRPNLTKVAFASDAAGDAGIDVISGLDQSQPAATTPTLFPGPGMTTYLTTYGEEYPDPLETCGWPSDTPAGLPMIAMLPAAPAQGLTATVTGPDGTTLSTADGSLCAVDENNYHSSDQIYGPTGKAILQGDHAVLLFPKTALTWGRYTPDITQSGQPDVTWSFIAAVPGQVQGGHAYELHVSDSGASTVLGNLTAVGPATNGFTTAYPCGQALPLASNSNYVGGQTVAGFAAVHPDANGDICLYTKASSDLIWDQVAETSAITAGTPDRLLDTRKTGNRPAADGTITLHVADPGTATVLGNLTAVNPSGVGFTTAYPCGTTLPLASNSNYAPGQTVANFVAVHPDANGDICLYTKASADLVWDQVAQTSAITTTAPQRLLDTRKTGNRPAAGGTITLHVADPGTATVLGNLTAVNPSGIGFTTAYPCGTTLPTASNSNYVKGQTVANFVTVHPDANGDICLYTKASADLVWDQVAQTNAITTTAPQRLLDTRTESSHLG